MNFKNIKYLKYGNERQKRAYYDLMDLDIMEKLKEFKPILTGTIPIEIDLPNSDLDIICEYENHKTFSETVINLFGKKPDFKIQTTETEDMKSTVASFNALNFMIEIFGQNKATIEQNAYRHMLIEYRILQEKGGHFRDEIIALKSEGLKTEPAFAKLLSLKGNPFDALLELEKNEKLKQK